MPHFDDKVAENIHLERFEETVDSYCEFMKESGVSPEEIRKKLNRLISTINSYINGIEVKA